MGCLPRIIPARVNGRGKHLELPIMKKLVWRKLSVLAVGLVLAGVVAEAQGSITLATSRGYRAAKPSSTSYSSTKTSTMTSVAAPAAVALVAPTTAVSVVVPEPGTLAVWSGLALLGLGYGYRRQRAG